ncbi:MAG TPA: hypothetical protein VFX16_11005 [Pseudonocardiaceae bacterium]|nr:hypothetical protein [Pseudonocardiaceae bacterium]
MKRSILIGLAISAIAFAVAVLIGSTGASATTLPATGGATPTTDALQPTVIG